jgi:glutathione peroxidase
MRNIIFLLIIMFSFFSNSNAQYNQLAENFTFNGIDGEAINISKYKNNVIVIVNVASRCGFTNQYEDLQNLWTNFKKDGLVVIGVPTDNFKQEPGTNNEIKSFCETTFGIDFPLTQKTNVLGKNAHPFFIWAKENHGRSAIPKWNFHKIIVGKDGKVAETFTSITKPSSNKFIKLIKQELKK